MGRYVGLPRLSQRVNASAHKGTGHFFLKFGDEPTDTAIEVIPPLLVACPGILTLSSPGHVVLRCILTFRLK